MNISIVMSVYNRLSYIGEAISTLLCQSYANWELIIVDDGSSSDVPSALHSFLDDSRIRFIRKENGGVSSARNLGVRESSAPWIAFIDDDDIWFPEKLEVLVSAIAANPGIAMLISDALIVDDVGAPICGFQEKKNIIKTCSWFNNPGGFNLIQPGMDLRVAYSGFALPSAFAVRKKEFLDVGGFDENIRGCEDMDLVFRMSLQNPIGYYDKKLIGYRVTESGLSRKNKIYAFQQSVKLYEKTIACNLNKDDREFLLKSQVNVRAGLAYCYFKNNEYKLCRYWVRRTIELGWHKGALFYGFLSFFPPSTM